MLDDFRFYDLYVTGFVQLAITTILVFGPARTLDLRLRWRGSRFIQVLFGTLGAIALAAGSSAVAALLFDLTLQRAGSSAYLLAIASIIVVVMRSEVGIMGRLFSASYTAAGLTFVGYAASVAADSTRSVGEMISASVFVLMGTGAFIVWNSSISYASDVMTRSTRGRPLPVADPTYQPFVSIHVPAYNEPPELLIETIKAIEAMDYPNFEIVVMENNTTDPAVWRPVEEYCRGRERITFVHVENWPGYKAGACNLALREYTDPRAEIIGIIDADDIVKPYYLKEVVPHFCDPDVGFIQTFEGNRDYEGSNYYQACVDSYQGFYVGIMSSRNERDSVPFVGTMGLFRREALEEVGGWNEWCICEDTEASVRVHKAGWSGLYIPRCFGRGVVPPTFRGLNTQRYRWCFGGMQILRLHWRSLMPWDRSPDNHLTAAQRRDYLMGGLAWFRDPLMFLFSLVLLATTVLLKTDADFALMPLAGGATVLPMSLILVATGCITWTLRHWTSMNRRRGLRALVVALSASWVTSLGCVHGLTYREGRFLRTSKKGADEHPLRTAFRLSRVETALSLALYAAGIVLLATSNRPWLLIIVLLVQASVYACGPAAAIWNMRAQRVPATEYRQRDAVRRARAARRRPRTWATARFAGALVVAAVLGGIVASYASPEKLAPVPAQTVGPLDGAAQPGR